MTTRVSRFLPHVVCCSALLAVAAAAAPMAAVVQAAQREASGSGFEPHEKAVYEAVIEDVLQHPGRDHARHIAIRVPTATGQRPGSTGTPEADLKKLLDDLEPTTGPLGPGLRAHFIELNRTTHPLSGELKLSVPYVIKAFDLSPRDFWEQFYKTYPGSAGIVVFSRVGFDDGFSRALVYVEHLHGNRAMSGEYLLLTHGANGWQIAKRMPSWIA